MSTPLNPTNVSQFVKDNLLEGVRESVFKNLVFENSEYWEFFTSLNGSFKEKFDAYMQEPATKKAEWLKREIDAWKKSKEKKTITPSKETPVNPEPMKKVDIKADPKTRRLLINTLGILYEIQQEAGSNLSLMLTKAKERHNAYCQKASAFLEHIAPGSTVVREIVEECGTSALFESLFDVESQIGDVDDSSELTALTMVWFHNYKKEWAGTNPQMTNDERAERFNEKKSRIIQKTADDIATFAGYENSEELTAELTSALPDALALLKEHLIAP